MSGSVTLSENNRLLLKRKSEILRKYVKIPELQVILESEIYNFDKKKIPLSELTNEYRKLIEFMAFIPEYSNNNPIDYIGYEKSIIDDLQKGLIRNIGLILESKSVKLPKVSSSSKTSKVSSSSKTSSSSKKPETSKSKSGESFINNDIHKRGEPLRKDFESEIDHDIAMLEHYLELQRLYDLEPSYVMYPNKNFNDNKPRVQRLLSLDGFKDFTEDFFDIPFYGLQKPVKKQTDLKNETMVQLGLIVKKSEPSSESTSRKSVGSKGKPNGSKGKSSASTSKKSNESKGKSSALTSNNPENRFGFKGFKKTVENIYDVDRPNQGAGKVVSEKVSMGVAIDKFRKARVDERKDYHPKDTGRVPKTVAIELEETLLKEINEAYPNDGPEKQKRLDSLYDYLINETEWNTINRPGVDTSVEVIQTVLRKQRLNSDDIKRLKGALRTLKDIIHTEISVGDISILDLNLDKTDDPETDITELTKIGEKVVARRKKITEFRGRNLRINSTKKRESGPDRKKKNTSQLMTAITMYKGRRGNKRRTGGQRTGRQRTGGQSKEHEDKKTTRTGKVTSKKISKKRNSKSSKRVSKKRNSKRVSKKKKSVKRRSKKRKVN